MGNVLSKASTDAWSFSVWLLAKDYGASGRFFVAKGVPGWYMATATTGQIAFSLRVTSVSDDLNMRTNTKIPQNEWVHVVGTYDGSKTAAGVKIYLNGISQPLTIVYNSLTGNIANAENFTIGAYGAALIPWNGNITKARLHSRVLTANEVWNLYSRDEAVAVQAYWPFMSTNSATLPETVGGLNGTITGAVWSDVAPRQMRPRIQSGTNAQADFGNVIVEYDMVRSASNYTNGEQLSTLFKTNGTAADATNATAAATKPTFEVNQFGDKPGLKFVRASNQYVTPPLTFSSGPSTLAFVAKLSSLPASGEFYWLCHLSNGTNAALQVGFSNAAGYGKLTFRGNAVGTGNSVGTSALVLDTNPHVYVITYNGGTNTATASYRVFVDGASAALATSGSFFDSLTSELGRFSLGAFSANMVLGSFVLLRGALNAGDCLTLSRSMGKSFGITTA